MSSSITNGFETVLDHLGSEITEGNAAGRKFLRNPWTQVGYVGINTWDILLCTANTPSHNAGLVVTVGGAGNRTDQWRTAITLACVLSLLTTGADETFVQIEVRAQTSLSQIGLAPVVWYNGQIDFLQNNLVLAVAIELILAPASGIATAVIKVGIWLGQTDGSNVLLPFEGLFKDEQSHIVVQCAFVVSFVSDDLSNAFVNMGQNLVGVLGVPFTATYHQLIGFAVDDTVGRGQDNVVGNQRATAVVQMDDFAGGVFGAENCHHPGEFGELRLIVVVASNSVSHTVFVAPSTTAMNYWWQRRNYRLVSLKEKFFLVQPKPGVARHLIIAYLVGKITAKLTVGTDGIVNTNINETLSRRTNSAIYTQMTWDTFLVEATRFVGTAPTRAGIHPVRLCWIGFGNRRRCWLEYCGGCRLRFGCKHVVNQVLQRQSLSPSADNCQHKDQRKAGQLHRHAVRCDL